MKFKYVLLSGLFLSTGFVACTNEELTEISVPVNTSEAIALGENFTIKVNKGVESRAAFDNVLTPYWEEGDKLGAAWVHKVTKVDEDDNTVVVDASNIGGTYKGFYSNSPLTLKEGAGTNDGTFVTVDDANLFAGAYVLYSPYDKTVSMQGDAIPVSIKSYEFDAANPLKNISENMFSYSPVKFVPGGNQTGDFSLGQVPVLFRLSFTADKKLNMDLSDGITIENIVIEASKSSTSVLVAEGKIVTKTAPSVEDYNAPAEDDALADIVEYQNVGNVDHLFITAKGTDNDDYKMLVEDEPTKKEFVFTVLPFSDKADKVTIKVVTDKGTYKKEYASTDTKYINEFNNAIQEGGQVRVDVVLDVTEKDDVIYTAEEFASKWNDAVKAGEPATLNIGTPLTLTEALSCNNTNAQITVTGHELTVPSMDLQKTSKNGITFNCPVVVEGKLFATGDAKLTATDLTAETVEIQGDANLTVAEVKEMSIATSGVVTVAGKDTESTIGKIVNRGRLIPNTTNLVIESLDSTDGNVAFDSNFTNKGTMTLSDINMSGNTFTNEGTVTLSGVFTGVFTNEAGATLNINADQTKMKLTNNAADATKNKDAAVVNIAADVTVTADGTNTIENNGIINVNGTLTENADGALVQAATATDARINVASTGSISINATTKVEGGYVMVEKTSKVNKGSATNIAANVEAGMTTSSINANVDVCFMNGDFTDAQLKTFVAKNLVFTGGTITMSNNLKMTSGVINIDDDVTFAAAANKTPTLTLVDNSDLTVYAGAKLTIGENVTVASATATGAEIVVEKGGSLVNKGAYTNVTVTLK